MKEIEVKGKLRDADAVRAKLAELGCALSEPATQDDVVYVRTPGDLATYLANDVFVRIRVQNGTKVLLTAKKPMTVNDTEHLVKMEHEVTVDSREEAEAMLELMGYAEGLRIKKRGWRRTIRTAKYVSTR